MGKELPCYEATCVLPLMDSTLSRQKKCLKFYKINQILFRKYVKLFEMENGDNVAPKRKRVIMSDQKEKGDDMASKRKG